MVGPRVGSRGEPDHALAQRVSQPPRQSAAMVAMDEGRRAAGPIGGTQTTDLAGGEPEEISRSGHQEGSSVEGMEDLQTLLGSLCQGNHASLYSARGREDIFGG